MATKTFNVLTVQDALDLNALLKEAAHRQAVIMESLEATGDDGTPEYQDAVRRRVLADTLRDDVLRILGEAVAADVLEEMVNGVQANGD